MSRNDLDTKFRGQIEDSLDRPLASLGLLSRIDRDVFQVSRGNQASLPQAVLTYAIADFWDRYASEQKSISIERLLYDPGSPGAAFRLTDTTLVDHLETLPVDSGFLYDETAGQRKLLRNTFVEPLDHLKQHYRATFH